MTAGSVRTNGIDTYYVLDGQAGPWLVLAHSLACDVHMWDEEARRWSPSHRVLRYDARGHGLSSATPAPYELETLADDLHELLLALGVEKPHFVGLSMGGMIGQAFALRHPGRLASLALCDTTSRYPATIAPERHARMELARHHGMEALVEPTLGRWVTDRFIREHPEAVRKLSTMVRGTSVDGYVGCTHANMHVNYTERLKEIDCPTLVLVGEQDSATPPTMAEAIYREIRGSQLVVLPDAPHLANIECPDAFDAAISGFLRRVGR